MEKTKKGSPEHRQKMREIALRNGSKPPSKLGWNIPARTRQKMAASAKGKSKPWLSRPLTEDHRAKIAEANKDPKTWGVLFNPEVRQRAMANARLVHPKKEKHWAWKGGVAKDREFLRTIEWKDWRKAVYTRDNYTCQRCQIRGHQLHAHHKIPRRIRPDLIHDIDNGMTLCNSCHPIVENEFRRSGGAKSL